MWKPPINFLTLHYAWIIGCGILGLIVIYPFGNVPAVDAYFFGVSSSTESGLNTIDVKALKTYQQLVIYFIPIITNLGFIQPVVIAVRLYSFKRKLKGVKREKSPQNSSDATTQHSHDGENAKPLVDSKLEGTGESERKPHIMFSPDTNLPRETDKGLYVPPPPERRSKTGDPSTPNATSRHANHDDDDDDDDEDAIKPIPAEGTADGLMRRRHSAHEEPRIFSARSLEKAASSLFVVSPAQVYERRSDVSALSRPLNLPSLSKTVTLGRNSRFHNLTEADREKLGGLEYRALKLLLPITLGYFFGLHLLGVICLAPWIHNAPSKYTEWLASNGQDKTWWAFYSAQTMVNNLGFTLTPDSMITFRDATWPILVMAFLAFAGNTCYPIFLRVLIWILHLATPSTSPHKEPLKFILDHPRRCYTLLFPSRPTWILFAIVFVLNAIDVVLIIVLDLHNDEVASLPIGSRILAALFQAASSRHTGTATFNLANVNPGVQFSLLVMMYIAVLPIAISIRASNTYEERTLGLYEPEMRSVDESSGRRYVMAHIRNQLSFDLWYVFLGTFCICVAEAERIVDLNEPAFSVFPVMFEVVSAYGNVGLSLGHPMVMTSLCGQFTTFSKLVICAMMIRGRHRALPYSIDHAIMLPHEEGEGQEEKRES
ncbi:potassium transporter [Immersiella caudata]|uniref:Potassium transporter n=1 Tax=Immersiella caudata TaxID=314043 RepID=A0AA40C3U1_9PEZI|nr:potassium transporter [Immersiella caudata]